jgi:predicted lipoprotein
MRLCLALALTAAGLVLSSCRLVATADVQAIEKVNGAAAFDPDGMVADMWPSKVAPYLQKKAGSFAEVHGLAAKNPDAAGARYGYRAKSDGTPWTYVIQLEGVVLAANTQSRAATMDVDTTGSGKVDAVVQLGPVMRGTALRDALDFVKFGDFTNQIDYAQFGKAFNTYAYKSTLERLPRDALVGKRVKVLGAYTVAGGDGPPLVTPAAVEIEPDQ